MNKEQKTSLGEFVATLLGNNNDFKKDDGSFNDNAFMKSLGFPNTSSDELMDEDGEINEYAFMEKIRSIVGEKEFSLVLEDEEKEIFNLQISGKIGSITHIFGSHLDLIEVKGNREELNKLRYYHPDNYKPELEYRNFGFCSADFTQRFDPQKHDHLSVHGSTIRCIIVDNKVAYTYSKQNGFQFHV